MNRRRSNSLEKRNPNNQTVNWAIGENSKDFYKLKIQYETNNNLIIISLKHKPNKKTNNIIRSHSTDNAKNIIYINDDRNNFQIF